MTILRSYRISGPAMCDVSPAVIVRIQETIETRGILVEFLQWCMANSVFSSRYAGSTTGGGFHCACYALEDAAKIKKWLIDRGFTSPISDPANDP